VFSTAIINYAYSNYKHPGACPGVGPRGPDTLNNITTVIYSQKYVLFEIIEM